MSERLTDALARANEPLASARAISDERAEEVQKLRAQSADMERELHEARAKLAESEAQAAALMAMLPAFRRTLLGLSSEADRSQVDAAVRGRAGCDLLVAFESMRAAIRKQIEWLDSQDYSEAVVTGMRQSLAQADTVMGGKP